MRAVASLLVACVMLLGPAIVPGSSAGGRGGGLVHADGQNGNASTEMAPADVARWLVFFDKLVDIVVRDEAACNKMAGEVNAAMDANRDAIAIARNAKAQNKKLPAAAKQRMIDGVKKMLPGMHNCGTNERVRAAFAKLDLNRRG
ncbi:MAG TPA: hypothetical protein VLB44_08750 [Kofleriaceae bacterium]|nr:hypothetical protein [Kofleriaceae bacterium]